MFVKPAKIRSLFDLDSLTLQRWARKDFIRYIVTPENRYLYDLDSVSQALSVQNTDRKKIIYARVSSSKQKSDLTRQIAFLKESYPEHILYKDVGSSLNWQRKGFKAILEFVLQGNVEEVVVTDPDRLCRFSLDLIKQIFKHFDTRLVILCNQENSSQEEELAQDLLSIVNVFVARNNGRRAANLKVRRKKNKAVSK